MRSSTDYQQLAAQILPLVGGKENIIRVYHCQTRLRFTLADESKADDKALEALDGVRKVLRSGGVLRSREIAHQGYFNRSCLCSRLCCFARGGDWDCQS